MMTMRERRILAEANQGQQRVLHEGAALSVLIADKAVTLGGLLKIVEGYAAHGMDIDLEWLRDSRDNPYGVRLTGRTRNV